MAITAHASFKKLKKGLDDRSKLTHEPACSEFGRRSAGSHEA